MAGSFPGRALEAWAIANDVQLCLIRPGRPVENAFIESFDGRLRDECLNVEWFSSLEDAQEKLGKFREYYNHRHPHSSLAGRAPAPDREEGFRGKRLTRCPFPSNSIPLARRRAETIASR